MGNFEATFESLSQHAVPAWFDDAKLGIFVHWTAATVPAYAPLTDDPFTLGEQHGWDHALKHSPYVEWYQNSLAIPGSPVAEHHARHWPGVAYDEFVARFVETSEAWDPATWAELFADAGANYVVFVTKHHDGVTLWPSRRPNPFKSGWSTRRDCVSELADAVRVEGMRYGVYYSGGLDWTFGGLPMDSLGAMLAAIPRSPEYCAYADAHWRELIDLVGPDVLWNDIAYSSGARPQQLFADYYNRHPDGVVNDRFDVMGVRAGTAHADFVTPEYRTSTDVAGRRFEVCRGIGRSFGYNAWEPDEDLLAPDELIRMFVRIVAGGGNLLLNVGPTATGEIPAAQAARLHALGWWMRRNDLAIVGTRAVTSPMPTHTTDGIELAWTQRPGSTFALLLDTPAGSSFELPWRPSAGTPVRRLGDLTGLAWEPTDAGCRIELGVPLPRAAAHAFAFGAAAHAPD